jgi:hypothetical protein
MKVIDTLNNQFMFFDYLSTINNEIVQYIENNNISINYYCTYYNKLNNIHQLVTSNTTKKVNNGYRLITIEELEDAVDSTIIENDNECIIYYDYLIINITKCCNKNEIKLLGVKIFNSKIVYGGKVLDYAKENCDKNINEHDITEIRWPNNSLYLKLFKNVPKIHGGETLFTMVLPPILHTISLAGYNKIILPNMLPQNLHTLIVSLEYNKPFLPLSLPPSLQVLVLSQNYDIIIPSGILPKSLRIICFKWFDRSIIKKNIIRCKKT